VNKDIKRLPSGDFEVVSKVSDIGKPDRICMDCGKLFLLCHAKLEEDHTICPRCSSINHIEYVEAEHQLIEIEVPEGFEHPLEAKARELFNRLATLTGWREDKIRLWFQLPNPLLGNVPPEWMIMNGRAERLEKFISDAEEATAEYLDYARGEG
jgi:phage FluMu protein Com